MPGRRCRSAGLFGKLDPELLLLVSIQEALAWPPPPCSSRPFWSSSHSVAVLLQGVGVAIEPWDSKLSFCALQIVHIANLGRFWSKPQVFQQRGHGIVGAGQTGRLLLCSSAASMKTGQLLRGRHAPFMLA